MATIIRSARLESDPVTLDIPLGNKPAMGTERARQANLPAPGIKWNAGSSSGLRSDVQSELNEPAAEESRQYGDINSDIAPAKQSDELKFLKTQLRETEAALQEAKLHAESLMDESKAKAYAEGLASGREEGRRVGYEEFAEKAQTLAKVIESTVLLEQRVLELAEDQLVEIVMEAVCKIVGNFLSKESSVQVTVNEALNRAKGARIARIRLSPDDYRVVAEASVADIGSRMESIEFVPDETIGIGGCLLESDAGTLDCRLDAQLEQLKMLLLSVRREQAPG